MDYRFGGRRSFRIGHQSKIQLILLSYDIFHLGTIIDESVKLLVKFKSIDPHWWLATGTLEFETALYKIFFHIFDSYMQTGIF
mgnify:CR=1 FL=1